MMERKNTRGHGWAAALAVLTLGTTLAASQAALADGDKGKDGKGGKVPIVIGKPIITNEPPPKKK